MADLAPGFWATHGVPELPAENPPDRMQRRTYEVSLDLPQRYLRIEAELR